MFNIIWLTWRSFVLRSGVMAQNILSLIKFFSVFWKKCFLQSSSDITWRLPCFKTEGGEVSTTPKSGETNKHSKLMNTLPKFYEAFRPIYLADNSMELSIPHKFNIQLITSGINIRIIFTAYTPPSDNRYCRIGKIFNDIISLRKTYWRNVIIVFHRGFHPEDCYVIDLVNR